MGVPFFADAGLMTAEADAQPAAGVERVRRSIDDLTREIASSRSAAQRQPRQSQCPRVPGPRKTAIPGVNFEMNGKNRCSGTYSPNGTRWNLS